MVVGVGDELDDVGVSESPEQVELLPERAQPALAAAAPPVHLHGDIVPTEPGEVHGAGPAAADDGRLVEAAGQRLHLPPHQPPRLLLLRLRRRHQQLMRRRHRPRSARLEVVGVVGAAAAAEGGEAAADEEGGDCGGREEEDAEEDDGEHHGQVHGARLLPPSRLCSVLLSGSSS